MPLLEIVRAEQTDDATLATAFAVGKALKKTCVLVKDAPAFVVNRLLTRFMGEVIACRRRGHPVEVADRATGPAGPADAPFVLLELVGPAVALHVAETLHDGLPRPVLRLGEPARDRRGGQAAFYVTDADGTPVIDPEVAALLRAGRRRR